MSKCINKISDWMYQNKLKLNSDKTECLLIGRPSELQRVSSENICVTGDVISVCADSVVRNLGAYFDKCLSMEAHVSQCCKTSFFHLRNITSIRKYLSYDACVKLVHAMVTSRIDYCNSLLSGIACKHVKKLQSIQNWAARVVYEKSKKDHVTPLLEK